MRLLSLTLQKHTPDLLPPGQSPGVRVRVPPPFCLFFRREIGPSAVLVIIIPGCFSFFKCRRRFIIVLLRDFDCDLFRFFHCFFLY